MLDDGFTKAGQRWSWDFVLFMPVKDEAQLAKDRSAPATGGVLGRDRTAALIRDHTLLKVVSAINAAGLETCAYKTQRYDAVAVKARAGERTTPRARLRERPLCET